MKQQGSEQGPQRHSGSLVQRSAISSGSARRRLLAQRPYWCALGRQGAIALTTTANNKRGAVSEIYHVVDPSCSKLGESMMEANTLRALQAPIKDRYKS